jgi:hypothetical protein
MLKVYMDETGVHAGASVVAASAYVAKPSTWRAWTKKWKAAKHPVKVFHAADCANSRGEFVGWTIEQRDAFVAKLLSTLPEQNIAGLVVAIQMDDLRAALKGQPYACCFQWSIMTIIEFAKTYGKGERIKFIHEVNDSKGETQRTFDYVNQFHNTKRISASLAFGTKTENTPLQAADVLAYEGGKFLREKSDTVRRAWKALDPDNTRIISYRYGKENMGALVSVLKSFREEFPASG